MANLSYLFGTGIPTSVTGAATTTSETLPAWLQEYTRALMGEATEAAGTPFTAYKGARVASFSPLQQLAQSTTLANQGSWQPYVNRAALTVPKAINEYMSPYTSSVVDRIAKLGQRNFTDNLIPNVNSTFVGAGQFGSNRSGDWMARAVRDANESILGQQSSALQQGFQSAQQMALQDLQRYGALGQLQTQLGYTDVSMADTLGLQQQGLNQKSLDLGYSQFLEERDFPKTQIDFLNSIVRGLPVNQEQFRTVSYLTSPNMQGVTSPVSTALQAATGIAGVRKALGLG